MDDKKKDFYIISGIGIFIVILLIGMLIQNHNSPQAAAERSEKSSIASSEKKESSEKAKEKARNNKIQKLYNDKKFDKIHGAVILDWRKGIAYKTSWSRSQVEKYFNRYENDIEYGHEEIESDKDNSEITKSDRDKYLAEEYDHESKIGLISDLGTSRKFNSAEELYDLIFKDIYYFDSAKKAYQATVKYRYKLNYDIPLLKEVK